MCVYVSIGSEANVSRYLAQQSQTGKPGQIPAGSRGMASEGSMSLPAPQGTASLTSGRQAEVIDLVSDSDSELPPNTGSGSRSHSQSQSGAVDEPNETGAHAGDTISNSQGQVLQADGIKQAVMPGTVPCAASSRPAGRRNLWARKLHAARCKQLQPPAAPSQQAAAASQPAAAAAAIETCEAVKADEEAVPDLVCTHAAAAAAETAETVNAAQSQSPAQSAAAAVKPEIGSTEHSLLQAQPTAVPPATPAPAASQPLHAGDKDEGLMLVGTLAQPRHPLLQQLLTQ